MTTENIRTADPWEATLQAAQQDNAYAWLQGSEQSQDFNWMYPFDHTLVPFGDWVESLINWLVTHLRSFFQFISAPIDYILSLFQTSLNVLPPTVMIILFTLLVWQFTHFRLALATLLSITLIGAVGAWNEMMITLALVLTSVSFCLLIGLPLGIWMARSTRASAIVKPVLDAMQTTPAFVYLVPIVMLFGIGNVPGVVVTIIFALPPIVRLTILGIQQVPEALIEAAQAFGASKKQLLYKVQLPLAMPSIMAGVNQTLMLSLSMVVIASMIAVGGLGQMVLRGIGRLDMGEAATGGLGIVLMAIVLDRLTQKIAENMHSQHKVRWYERGITGLFIRKK
ncbi:MULTISPECIES: glycine betaine/L-proline ABC transporter permease ProW [Basfia]|uniref:ProW protein n=1 Tax=Mannheimia succiniciproducens (strain KCTC 0769BP / MBEL55E) TaxID=221988 RepID=Q65V53_MANSM|nr:MULTISPECIES: glycine betaine/L-proline ABC transporter permease ProW [Basfia]AAU37157.1 ProW protein [[Mannheimia] succiniciproducens MBEL55E]SEP63536.1 glycine betaine/proline transport system permease protein [Basfia succiniciproducens]